MSEPRGRLFGAVADDDDRVRRGYPDELVDEACARGALGPGSRAVEVGSGTGKLTVALAARGLAVDAVEPDAQMAAVARDGVPVSEAWSWIVQHALARPDAAGLFAVSPVAVEEDGTADGVLAQVRTSSYLRLDPAAGRSSGGACAP